MSSQIYERIQARLAHLYGAEAAEPLIQAIKTLIATEGPDRTPRDSLAVSEADAMLITYGDSIRRAGETPLQTLHQLLDRVAYPAINCVHILPFFPYSSDDGFSVIDYSAVDEALGDWPDVRALGDRYRLMFDAVFNHISAKSDWFEAFRRREAPYRDYFITVEPGTDLSDVVRPRALPLLTPVMTEDGEKLVWTTFSDDQIDLNLANPDVLMELLRILLLYVAHGAQFIRLDAIAFLWKVPGTSSIHLPETHMIIQIMRDVLDLSAPETILITETNVPHAENISYFGDGHNEAQLVYQFPLPPLILHTLATGDASALQGWAANLEAPGPQATYFNFTASHDGIGMRPATGILPAEAVDALVQRASDHGGYVSYRALSDGSKSPYELNITYFDAITHPDETARDPQMAVRRFMVSQAIMLALAGVPGIYVHSLFGSRNWREGVDQTQRFRTINREKLDVDTLLVELNDRDSIRAQVFSAYKRLLTIRRGQPAFHPLAAQDVLDLGPCVFGLMRRPDRGAPVLALHNVTDSVQRVEMPAVGGWRNLISGNLCPVEDGRLRLYLAPYELAWLRQDEGPEAAVDLPQGE